MAFTWDKKTIGRNLKAIRAKKGLTQAAMSDILGISQGHYANIEAGTRQFSLRLLARMCELLKVDPVEAIADWESGEVKVLCDMGGEASVEKEKEKGDEVD